MELISREAVLLEIHEAFGDSEENGLMYVIKNLPIIESRPKGKWRYSDHFMSEDWYQCSNCKNEIFLEQGTLPQEEDYNYCPKCGADMRGKE